MVKERSESSSNLARETLVWPNDVYGDAVASREPLSIVVNYGSTYFVLSPHIARDIDACRIGALGFGDLFTVHVENQGVAGLKSW